jgi:hypothetical protein
VRNIRASLVNASDTVTALHILWKKRIFLRKKEDIPQRENLYTFSKNNFHEDRII